MSIVLPVSDEFEDASSLVAHAVAVLADLADKPVADVARRIRTMKRDVVRARFMTRDASGMPLNKISGLIEQIASVLSYSASAEVEPQPAFGKQRKVGKSFVERCLFGQTFEGSFGLSIEIPMSVPGQLNFLDPFERRVTVRVFHGLDTMRRSLELGDQSLLEKDWKSGLNANMCEAFVQLADLAGDEVLIEPVWSPLVSPPRNLVRMKPVKIGKHAIELLDSVSRGLRTGVQRKDFEVKGPIIRLSARNTTANLAASGGERKIVIADRTGLQVHLILDSENYRTACDAHRDGIPVSVKGILEKQGKYMVLMQPHEFEVSKEDNSS